LLQVTQGNVTSESYTYDPVGNRLTSQGVAAYNYNASNHLTSTSNATYTYDYNGNAIKPIFEHVEGQTFGSKEECENAAANAEVQAGPLWNQAAANSQRRRH